MVQKYNEIPDQMISALFLWYFWIFQKSMLTGNSQGSPEL